MNERIRELIKTKSTILFPGTEVVDCGIADIEKFAELIVRMCADYADMAYDARCEYPGDYVAEGMGYGEAEGVTEWRMR